VGDVMGDVNSRRGRILTLETRGKNALVKALVPLAELLHYGPELRSMTGGKGTFTMEFHGYEAVPASMQDKVVREVQRGRAEEE
jgi:elongation factor G